MKKTLAYLALVPLVLSLAACGSSSSSTAAKDDVMTIGVVGEGEEHQAFVEEAKAQGFNVKIVNFTDYNQPNPALSNGDLDMNWYNSVAYLANYNVEKNDDIRVVGPTVIYPMALFSQKFGAVNEIPEGGEIAIPNDPTNLGRALHLLESNGLLKFKSADLITPTEDDIDQAASKIKVVPVDATQTVRSMESVAASVVNNDFIKDAGLNPHEALAMDDPANPSAFQYVNIFASRAGDEDKETYQKLVDVFHSKRVQDAVQEVTGGTAVEVTGRVDELRATLQKIEDAKRKGKA